MHNKPPQSLTRPSLEAHPFITTVNSILPLGFKHRADDREWPNQEGDADFYTDNFEVPGCVRVAALAPIQAMSDDTLARLCKIIRPEIFETKILSRDDLSRCAADNAQRFDEDDGEFTLEQLEGYIMAHAVFSDPTPWASLADLYNDSPVDQQAAIHGYFVHCRNRTLSVLMDVPGPDISIPESLVGAVKRDVIDGQSMIYSDPMQEWLREDVFLQQYQVQAILNSTESFFLLATAPTLSQAIAKATAYTKAAKGSLVTDSIVIKHQGSYLSKAEFKHLVPDDAELMEMIMSPVKLIWDLDFGEKHKRSSELKVMRLTQSALEAADPSISMQLQAQADELKQHIAARRIPEMADLRRQIFSVEKAFGLQWSKVHQLENDLGM